MLRSGKKRRVAEGSRLVTRRSWSRCSIRWRLGSLNAFKNWEVERRLGPSDPKLVGCDIAERTPDSKTCNRSRWISDPSCSKPYRAHGCHLQRNAERPV